MSSAPGDKIMHGAPNPGPPFVPLKMLALKSLGLVITIEIDVSFVVDLQ